MEAEKPNMDQFKALFKNPGTEPVFMLNLLKFKQEGGWASYARYSREVETFLKGVGGEMMFMVKPNELLIGQETWDLAMLVKYPSRKDYLSMVNNPGYQAIHKYRAEAVERSVLYASDEMSAEQLLAMAK
jgi:uncharacterized protein (DUF1330 family)